ncbi:MAG: STAS-like domain-containing protein [Chryseobacterium sp.]|nr:STAS-like domain-containing protein [Chryseobacterium sp.]
MNDFKNINLHSITVSTSTNSDGDKLYNYLSKGAIHNKIILNIDGHYILSTSFLNSSFGKFIDIYGLDLFKTNIKIKSNANIYNRLKHYVSLYSDLYVS